MFFFSINLKCLEYKVIAAAATFQTKFCMHSDKSEVGNFARLEKSKQMFLYVTRNYCMESACGCISHCICSFSSLHIHICLFACLLVGSPEAPGFQLGR